MFKIGDVIVGTFDNKYGITSSESICEVTDITEGCIWVEVIHQLSRPQYVGDTFPVDPQYFELANENQVSSILRNKNEDKFSKFLKRVETRHLKKAGA